MVQKLPSPEIGAKFGEWIVLEVIQPTSAKRAAVIRVRCVCGKEKILANAYLRAGGSQNCGCRRGRALAMSGITHNKSHTPTYRLWHGIKQRLKTQTSYSGIKMYGPWIDDFVAFEMFIESLGPKPTPEHTLDRIEPSGHYEPGNLRWADKTTQSVNRRNSMLRNVVENSTVKVGQKYDMLTVLEVFVIERHRRNWYGAKVQCECGTVKTVYQTQLLSQKTKSCGCFKNQNLRRGHLALEKPIEVGGRSMSMSAWARKLGVSRHVIWTRIHKYGWEPARAVTEPLQDDPIIEIDGEKLTTAQWSQRHGIPVHTIWTRIKKGWEPFDAVTIPVRAWTKKALELVN